MSADRNVNIALAVDTSPMKSLADELKAVRAEVKGLAADWRSLGSGRGMGGGMGGSGTGGGQTGGGVNRGGDGWSKVDQRLSHTNKLLERLVGSIERAMGAAVFQRAGSSGWSAESGGSFGGGGRSSWGPAGDIVNKLSPKHKAMGIGMAGVALQAGQHYVNQFGPDSQIGAGASAASTIGGAAVAGGMTGGPWGAAAGAAVGAAASMDKLAQAITGVSKSAEEAKQKLGGQAPGLLGSAEKADIAGVASRGRFNAGMVSGATAFQTPEQRLAELRSGRERMQGRISQIEGSYETRFGGNKENLFGMMPVHTDAAPGSGAWLANKLANEQRAQNSMMPAEGGRLDSLSGSAKEVEGLERAKLSGLQEEINLRKQSLDTEKQIADTAINAIGKQKAGLYEMLNVEKERQKAGRAEFGAMSRSMQNRTLRISDKLEAGKDLTRSELRFASQNPLFEKDVQKAYGEKAAAAGYDSNAGIQRRSKERETQIQGELKKLEDQLKGTVLPMKIDLQLEEAQLMKLAEQVQAQLGKVQVSVEQSGFVESRQLESTSVRRSATGR